MHVCVLVHLGTIHIGFEFKVLSVSHSMGRKHYKMISTNLIFTHSISATNIDLDANNFAI